MEHRKHLHSERISHLIHESSKGRKATDAEELDIACIAVTTLNSAALAFLEELLLLSFFLHHQIHERSPVGSNQTFPFTPARNTI
jgi:hypothetical protein